MKGEEELFGGVFLELPCLYSAVEVTGDVSMRQEEDSQYFNLLQVWGKESLSFSMFSEILLFLDPSCRIASEVPSVSSGFYKGEKSLALIT